MFLLIKLHAHSLIKDIPDRDTLILIILSYPIFRYFNLPNVHTSLIFFQNIVHLKLKLVIYIEIRYYLFLHISYISFGNKEANTYVLPMKKKKEKMQIAHPNITIIDY